MTTIFVFGSNLAGRHGKGAAKHAAAYYGAQRGVGLGRTGDAYAIPTKDGELRTLPLADIQTSVHAFLRYARANRHLLFKVTAIGTGLTGYCNEQIAPLFRGVPDNCEMPPAWGGLFTREIGRNTRARVRCKRGSQKPAVATESG